MSESKPHHRVTAIVLAAGESRRMGTLKPLLPYGSSTVIQTVVRSLKASRIDLVRVVLGHRSAEIGEVLHNEAVETVENPRYHDGMLSSAQTGLAASPADTEWFVIALGDQPFIKSAVVERLLRAATEPGSDAGIVVPSYHGRRGHPLLIHARYRNEIMALDPEVGLRELLQRHPGAIRHVVVPDEEILHDLDTPEDYRRALARQQQHEASDG